MPIVLKLAAVAALVLLNGFFVAAEFALVKVRQTQLEPLIGKGSLRARMARHVVAHLDASLSSCQLGITLASLALGWIGEPVFTVLLAPILSWLRIESVEWRHSLSFVIGFGVLTFLHITAGEQAPKWLAIQKPLPTALWVAQPLEWFHRASYPFIWLLNHASLWLVAQLGVQPKEDHGLTHSEDELRLLFAASQERAGRGSFGRDLVLNAMDLRRRVVLEVMRPRQQIVCLDTQATMAQCIDVAEKSRYSRFPLCEEGDPDRTLGVVHIKDLYAMRLKGRSGADLRPVARPAIYVPASARLERLLEMLLERRVHFAIVVDEYGGTIGMATLENLLEEIVGQIQDEFDQEAPLWLKLGQDLWELQGALPIHDLETLCAETIEAGDVGTVSGWVTQRLGGFPKVGDVLALGRCELRVEAMDGPRVDRMTLRRVNAPSP